MPNPVTLRMPICPFASLCSQTGLFVGNVLLSTLLMVWCPNHHKCYSTHFCCNIFVVNPWVKVSSASLAPTLLYDESWLTPLVFLCMPSSSAGLSGYWRWRQCHFSVVSIWHNDSYVFCIHCMLCWNGFNKTFGVVLSWVGLCCVSVCLRSVTVDQGLRGLCCNWMRKDTKEKH